MTDEGLMLSAEEIRTFRQYIEHKHPGGDDSRRASILDDALHRVVEQRLPDFPGEIKRKLRAELLLRSGGAGRFDIRADDALRASLALPLREEETLLSPLVSWACERAALAEKEAAVRDTLLDWAREPSSAGGLASLRREAERRHAEAAVDAAIERRDARRLPRRASAVAAAGLLLLAGALALPGYAERTAEPPAAEEIPAAPAAEATVAPEPEAEDYRYADIDAGRLQAYLAGRSSALAEEPYFSAIVGAAEKHDVHPLLLFAITGQEQSFVPTTHKQAERIASNPFNVFGSWETYQTDIDDSASLAAKLVAKRLSNRPDDAEPIQWINRSYAEDPNWWKGVSWFFEDMKKQTEPDAR
ncbi:hypothetical protein MO973_43250 [Paenibacillus sp. TRM 82003]|nr:hypothetical protein [Paenibacillus sp. TRM 82003]